MIVAWDIAEREEAQVAADLISRACIRERISKRRQKRLILHADNGSAMRAATLEAGLIQSINTSWAPAGASPLPAAP